MTMAKRRRGAGERPKRTDRRSKRRSSDGGGDDDEGFALVDDGFALVDDDDDEPAPKSRRKRKSEGEERSKRRRKKGRSPEYLPPAGEPPRRDPTTRQVRQIVGRLRQECSLCGYRRVCAFAPVKLQIERRRDRKLRHRALPLLKKGLKELSEVEGDWESALVAMLAGSEKDALLAGCLISELHRKKPKRVLELMDYAAERCRVDDLKAEVGEATHSRESGALQPGDGIDPDRLLRQMFRGQLLRMISFFADADVLSGMQELLVLDADEEGRLVQAEAVAVLSLLIGRQMNPNRWVKGLAKDAAGPFRATFAYRAPDHGGLDLFFPYRRGKRRSYLYYRRGPDGSERLSSVDKVRIDSLLHRIFLVFEGDASKTHRVFKELCRHINVRAGEYNANHVLEGFQRLDRDDLLLLGVYAPALARAVGHFLGIEGYHKLIKFLYELRSESGRRGDRKVAAHEKVVQERERWLDLVDEIGADMVKNVFSVLFRLNSSYKRRIYTTPTYLKIGEVAYLLTALSGWNPKGLQQELKQGRKALAFVAYGLQPPGRHSKARVGKIRRAYERLLDVSSVGDELQRAFEQGMRYMGALHGYNDFDGLEAAAAGSDWEPPEAREAHVPSQIEAADEDFSEFADESMDDSAEDWDPEASDDDEMLIVVDDDQTNDDGSLRSQRLPNRRDD
ncbi:MAG: hypothetical protein JKY65_12835 [Planctomycetes bacterium]|nr:hypothetical protein [Planctomycetota bacterium]